MIRTVPCPPDVPEYLRREWEREYEAVAHGPKPKPPKGPGGASKAAPPDPGLRSLR